LSTKQEPKLSKQLTLWACHQASWLVLQKNISKTANLHLNN